MLLAIQTVLSDQWHQWCSALDCPEMLQGEKHKYSLSTVLHSWQLREYCPTSDSWWWSALDCPEMLWGEKQVYFVSTLLALLGNPGSCFCFFPHFRLHYYNSDTIVNMDIYSNTHVIATLNTWTHMTNNNNSTTKENKICEKCFDLLYLASEFKNGRRIGL